MHRRLVVDAAVVISAALLFSASPSTQGRRAAGAPVERINGPTTIAIAATVGKTRLIDNTLIGQ